MATPLHLTTASANSRRAPSLLDWRPGHTWNAVQRQSWPLQHSAGWCPRPPALGLTGWMLCNCWLHNIAMWLRLPLCKQKSRENQVKRFPSSTFGIYGMFIQGRVCLLAVGFDPRQSPIQYRISCHRGGKGTDDSESKHGSGNQPSSISSGCGHNNIHQSQSPFRAKIEE